MARPPKSGLDYFPHDTDALGDEKVEMLITLYGAKGYTFYFGTLERIYRQPNFELDVSDSEMMQLLAMKLGMAASEYKEMLKTALKYRCFDPDIYSERGCLTSSGVKKRASVVVDKRNKMKALYETKKVSAAETIEEIAETTPETPQSKVDKSINIEKKKKNGDSAKKRITHLPDVDWIASLKVSPAYAGIDVERELHKCLEWFKAKNITVSQKRFLNWLNRADKPLERGNHGDYKGNSGSNRNSTSEYAGLGTVCGEDDA